MNKSLIGALALALCLGPWLSTSADEARNLALRYVPPKTNSGAPEVATRLGGATRGPTSTEPQLIALVPEHVALASNAQPTLLFYLADETQGPVELTLSQEDADEPVFEAEFPGPLEGGVHTFALAEHGVRLEPGQRYEWYVTLRRAPEPRASDTFAGGALRVVPPSDEIAQALTEANHSSAAFAAHGYWHDALAGATPAERTRLLEQVGLTPSGAKK